MTTMPSVSIVIPTHNRAERLEQTLGALERQTYPLAQMEIVVCADGCRDGTRALLDRLGHLPLSVVELPGLGPAGARNAGAAAARAPFLIFLDDDVEPLPDFVAAHVEAHEAQPQAAILGPYPPCPMASRSAFRLGVRHWWTQHFAALVEPGHRMRYTDVLTGNLSMARSTWDAIGGLDPRLRAREDYELGLRLIEGGVPVVVAPRAFGHHHEHETMLVDKSFRRSREEGRADILIAQTHPQARNDLKAVIWRRWSSRKSDLLDRLLLGGGRGTDWIMDLLARLLPPLDRIGFRRLHSLLFRSLQSYWYIRGVGDRLPTFRAWRSFALEGRDPVGKPDLRLDLRDGIEAAEATLDRLRPGFVELRYGHRILGHLPRAIGAEPWAGRHLRPYLVRHLGPAYLRALAADDVIVPLTHDEFARLDTSLGYMAMHYGPRRSPWTWDEQYQQWRGFLSAWEAKADRRA
ncbi:glycosyltransferase family 2 protein [Rubellimicrobium roseum]|uniref:Glycosyltransferase family 2 protein n=1 Tax=Rubellimicrobium roseum TaxID=687525 RepID=A0A5C4N986_9RHOB|nr:glycosyltransferase [Rubellimicrobium roseum]TNC71391.1 glycosyltransferase family 2 protein [Rubellimicrobium roseum]